MGIVVTFSGTSCTTQANFVQLPISANPGLKFNMYVLFFVERGKSNSHA